MKKIKSDVHKCEHCGCENCTSKEVKACPRHEEACEKKGK